MTTHHENEEEHLSSAEDLAADGAKQYFSCVAHVVNVRVAEFELSDYEAGVRGYSPHACN